MKMNLIIPLFILFFLVLVVYFSLDKYDSLGGLFLLLFGIMLLLLRILVVGKTSFFYVKETFWISGLWTAVITVFGACFILSLKSIRKGLDYNFKYLIFLLVLYIFFGYLQQLLFQFMFFETVYYLTGKITMSIFISAFYYFIFHLRSKRLEFQLGTFLIGLMWSANYLFFGNLFWLGISHGIIGTMYYLNLFDQDMLRKKISFIDKLL